MKVAIFVTSCNSLQTVEGHGFDLLLCGRIGALRYDLVEIFLHELEYEVKRIFLTNNFLQLHNIVMVELAKRFDFS